MYWCRTPSLALPGFILIPGVEPIEPSERSVLSSSLSLLYLVD